MLGNLIGAQITNIFDEYIEVKKDGRIFKLEIVSDDGDCCGYAEFETKLFYLPNSERNPVITNVTLNYLENYDGVSSILTFYGESKPLATIESEAGSGSGWSYGAYVQLVCKELEIDETLASW